MDLNVYLRFVNKNKIYYILNKLFYIKYLISINYILLYKLIPQNIFKKNKLFINIIHMFY
jgi:hypothetical protein